MGLLNGIELQPFQKIGAQNVASNFHHLLADEPGLGKTLQILAAVAFHKFKRSAVVCPAGVRSHWKDTIKRVGLSLDNFHVDSYEAATNGKFPAGPYDCIIPDEAHYLKNADSLRTQALFGNELGLARQARFKWPLTGTPFLKRPREVYPVLKCLHEPALLKAGIKNFDDYAHRFCGSHWDGREFNTKGATNLDQLRELMGSFMTRRTVDEVMPELPPILLSKIGLELTADERAPIDEIEKEILNREAFMSSVREDYSSMGDSARIRRATGEAMAKQAAEFIDEKINCGAGKVVVFFRHTAVGRILERELGHRFPVFFAGGMSDAQKDKAKRTFMEKDGDCEVFLGQMQASGTGIDGLQTCCHTVVDVEPDWVTEDMRQRFARLRRMGMDLGRPVNAYILYVPGTIQAAIIEVNVREAKTIEKLVKVSAVHSGIKRLDEFQKAEIDELMGDL